MESTLVSPQELRDAARRVIIEGADVGVPTMELIGPKLTGIMVELFRAHRPELLKLAVTYPPQPAAELRLLEYCLSDDRLMPLDKSLFRDALLETVGEVANGDSSCLNGAILLTVRDDGWVAHTADSLDHWSLGATRTEAVGKLIESHPQEVAAAIKRCT